MALPQIIVHDQKIPVGTQRVNFLKDARAFNEDDEDITHALKVSYISFDPNTKGEYELIYTVVDDDGNKNEKIATITVF